MDGSRSGALSAAKTDRRRGYADLGGGSASAQDCSYTRGLSVVVRIETTRSPQMGGHLVLVPDEVLYEVTKRTSLVGRHVVIVLGMSARDPQWAAQSDRDA